MAQPTIEVRANYLGQLPGADPHYHLLIVVRDGHGNNTYYRGGPSDNVTSSGASSGASSSGSGGSPGTGGKLITEFGPYVPGGTDFDRSAKVIYKAKLKPEDVSRVKDSLANQMNAIDRAQINYFPTGPNSNSTAGTALRNIGIKNIQIPKGMWVPGFERQLINQNGQRTSSNSTSSENVSLPSSSTTDKTTTVADNNSETRQQTATNSGKAAELVARANKNIRIGEPSNNNNFAKSLVSRATNTEPIEKQNKSNPPDGLQKQKSITSTTVESDNKKVQALQRRGISRQ